MSHTVKVVAIVGAGRSGSTLLDQLLGSLDGYFSAGELRQLRTRPATDDLLCGCGALVSGCHVWQAVRGRDAGSTGGPLRSRHLPVLARIRDHRAAPNDIAQLAQRANDLYRRIATVTGCQVIIDSSKHPADAMLLRLLPDVDAYLVHLVRDPRAVAYSWGRVRREPGTSRPDTMLPRYSVLRSSGEWLALNAGAAWARRHHGHRRSLLVRYEDLVHDPRGTVQRVTAMAGEVRVPTVLDDGTVALGANHTVAGNPRRFDSGLTRITEDVEWKTALPRRRRLLVSALTGPLAAAWGYMTPDRRVATPGGRDRPEPVVTSER